jgi:hypothetical protein
MKDEWNRDPAKWNTRPLAEQLEMLRKFYCTGPCGQSASVLGTRGALDRTIREAQRVIRGVQSVERESNE